jgi:uncharacterized membrane protein YgcG
MKVMIIKIMLALIFYFGAMNMLDIYSPKIESDANIEMLNGNLDSYERNQLTKKTVKFSRISVNGLFILYVGSVGYKEIKKQQK